MIRVVRKTFEERYNKYLKEPEKAKEFIQTRLKYMPIEELAYILAEHDKFSRIGCAEYLSDDTGEERLLDPLGRKVDPWVREIKH